jgi:hypothetical protein
MQKEYLAICMWRRLRRGRPFAKKVNTCDDYFNAESGTA